MASNRVSFVSLGCPKALVDAEEIVTALTATGYDVVAEGDEAEVVVVNTCGFIDSAKEESFDAIGDALDAGRRVVVTGCLGAKRDELTARFPGLEAISGPADAAPVVAAVQQYAPAGEAPSEPQHMQLTPEHYAYLKISEGCNHTCSFCIIPSMRGPLRSRRMSDVLSEAEALIEQGTKELLVIAQDLSAYGLDVRYARDRWRGETLETRLYDLCRALGAMAPWVRLHYVYPYPHVDALVTRMAEGLVLPYLDIPLQHASPPILKAMRRPAAAEKTLERIRAWREVCPDIGIRSTFIVGFPGETDEDVGVLLDFLDEAELDRVGCFTYSAVQGASANALPDHVDARDMLDRQEAVYEHQAAISARRLSRHVGERLRVLIDEAPDGDPRGHLNGDLNGNPRGKNATWLGRSQYDAPEIDGVVHVRAGAAGSELPRVGEFVWAHVDDHDDHDLYATSVGKELRLS